MSDTCPAKVLSIYKFGLSACLSVCLYPINVKTAKPIGTKFFVGHQRDHREGLRMIKIKKNCVLKVFNFVKNLKS